MQLFEVTQAITFKKWQSEHAKLSISRIGALIIVPSIGETIHAFEGD